MSRSTLLSGLDQVSGWRQEREGFFAGKENEFSLRERQIHEQMEQLNVQLATVQNQREELRVQHEKLDLEEGQKAREAVLNGLQLDASLIAERDVFYQELLREREERVRTLIESPSLRKKVQEFEQFQDTQQQFDSLPESYRTVILKHHDEVRAELAPVFNAFAEPLRMLEESKQNLGIVATVDPADDRPEALALTIPIPFSIYTNLNEFAESLQHTLAYRCCAAVSGMLLRAGVPSAPVQFVDYNGMISIRVWLGDHDVTGDLKTALQLEIERLEKKSSELKAVQLGLEVAWVSLDVLMDDGE